MMVIRLLYVKEKYSRCHKIRVHSDLMITKPFKQSE